MRIFVPFVGQSAAATAPLVTPTMVPDANERALRAYRQGAGDEGERQFGRGFSAGLAEVTRGQGAPYRAHTPWGLILFLVVVAIGVYAFRTEIQEWMQGWSVPVAVQQTVCKKTVCAAPTGQQESRSYSIERKTW